MAIKKEDADVILKKYDKELTSNNISLIHTDGRGEKFLKEYEKIEFISAVLPVYSSIEIKVAETVAKDNNVKLRDWSTSMGEDDAGTACKVFSTECSEAKYIETGIESLIKAREIMNEKFAKAAKFIYEL